MRVFIKDLTEITPEKFSIGYIHYMPFDAVNGLKMAEAELIEVGVLVELPVEPQPQNGCTSVLYYNPSANDVWYEYVEISPIPLTPEQQEVADLKSQVADLNLAMAAIMGGAV